MHLPKITKSQEHGDLQESISICVCSWSIFTSFDFFSHSSHIYFLSFLHFPLLLFVLFPSHPVSSANHFLKLSPAPPHRMPASLIFPQPNFSVLLSYPRVLQSSPNYIQISAGFSIPQTSLSTAGQLGKIF